VSLNSLFRIPFIHIIKCSFTTSAQASKDDTNDDQIDAEVYQYLKECLSDVNFITDDTVLDSIVRAILKTLVPVYGNSISVSKLQNFGPAGIRELALSIHREQERKRARTVLGKKAKLKIQIKIPHHTTEFVGTWRLGQSLLDVAKQNHPDLLGEYMEGTCGGQMSCCTCHVYLDETTFRLVQHDVDEAELDMLDLAYEPQPTSRLGCQVQLTPSLLHSIQEQNHTVTITIPAGVNDVWK
jgi:ferredoxin